MVIQLPTKEEIENITRNSLRNNFPLYQEQHKVGAMFFDGSSDRLWVGYRTKWSSSREIMNSTHLDLNVMNDVFYLVSIGLDENERGKGLGWKLYETTHEIAKELGCAFVRTTPSGWSIKDGKKIQSRRDYLLKRGYVPVGERQVDWIVK